jgi:hypothetical protein
VNQELAVLPEMSPEVVKGLTAPTVASGDVIAASMIEAAQAGILALKFASEITEITTPEQYKDVQDGFKSCHSTKKKIGEVRSGFTDPFEAWKKRNIAAEKLLDDFFDQAAAHYNKLAVDWKNKQDAIAAAEKARILREFQEKEALAKAKRDADEAAEQLKRCEEDAWIEYAQMEAEAKAEEEGAGTVEHVKANAEADAEKARIEEDRARRDAERQKAEADAEAKRQEELRKASAELSTLKNTATKGVKKTWDFTIVNPDKVVRQFLIPDEKKIRAANKAGLLVDGEGKPTELAAGLNIFEVSGLTGRGAGAR